MLNSLPHHVHLRELFHNKKHNPTTKKYLPLVGVENFECRRTQAFHLYSMLEPSSPPFACDFSTTHPDFILIAQEDGLIHLYDTSAVGLRAFIRHYEAHANAVFDVRWLSSSDKFLTASGDQSIRLIDTESGVILMQLFGHTMSVRSLSLMPGEPQIFASASRDGTIRLWDIRNKPHKYYSQGSPCSSVGLLSQCHVPDRPVSVSPECSRSRRTRKSKYVSSDARSVTSVLFMDDNTLLSAGSTDGSIKMWDLRHVYPASSRRPAKPKLVLPYRGISQKRSGYSDLVLDSYRSRLYANCLDNVIYEYDLTKQTSTKPIFIYTGHVTDSFYVKLDISPDDSFIVCGSSDRCAHIYTIGRSRQRPIVLSGHTGEVSVPRWCKGDPTRIVTLSDESQAFVWNMFPARRFVLPEPGELAGLAELLSPSKTVMSPSEQEKRVLQSPHAHNKGHDLSLRSRPSRFTSARRRQSNIRHFLHSISPPLQNASTTTVPNRSPVIISSTSLSSAGSIMTSLNYNQVRRFTSGIALQETPCYVVQRFPGSLLGLTANPTGLGTPPLGCYSVNCSPMCGTHLKPKSSSTPDRSPVDKFYSENYENINPDTFQASPQALPFDDMDGWRQNNSPIVRCLMERVEQYSTTPISAYRHSKPLGQALFNIPSEPGLDDEVIFGSRKHRIANTAPPSPSSPLPSSSIFAAYNDLNDNDIVKYKRRRLTFSTSSAQTSPSTPTRTRNRRMTSYSPSVVNPITKYFKRYDR